MGRIYTNFKIMLIPGEEGKEIEEGICETFISLIIKNICRIYGEKLVAVKSG